MLAARKECRVPRKEVKGRDRKSAKRLRIGIGILGEEVNQSARCREMTLGHCRS